MASGSQPFGDGAHPLRPYAVQPEWDAAFELPMRPVAGPTSSPPPRLPTPSSSTRLSPTGITDGYVELNEPGTSFLRSATAAGLLGFASTAMVMPFDVGKTLLQVQWIPREDIAITELEPEQRDFGAEEDELSDEAEAEAYFADVTSRPTATMQQLDASTRHRRPRDRAGYITRRSIYDESTKPEYIVPVVVTSGVWDMIRALVKSKHEGVTALWKGQLTTFVADTLTSAIQPVLASILTSSIAPTLAGLTLLESPRPGTSLALECAARFVTALILSPLDLVRTRLIVQSSSTRFRKYRGPWHALRHLIEDEGGLRSLYLHPNLLFPTLLEATFRPLLHLGVPLLLDRVVGLRAEGSPWRYGLAELGLSTLSLLVILPIETVRRRLQLQSRATTTTRASRPYRACVETRPEPYAGVVDAVYRIVTEETTSVPDHIARRRGRSRKSGATEETTEEQVQRKAGGTGQLFRGFQVGFVANCLVFALSIVSPREATI